MGAKVLLVCLIGFAFIDAASVRLLTYEREAYGAVVAAIGLVAVFALMRSRYSNLGAIFAFSWVGLGVLALIQGAWANGWDTEFVVGDFGVMMVPILLFIAGNSRQRSIFDDPKFLDTLGKGLIVAAGVSYFFGRDWDLGGRYDPPNLFLAAWLIAKVLSSQTMRATRTYLSLLFLFGLVAFLSNERTTVMIWGGGVVYMLMGLRGQKFLNMGIPIILLAIIGAWIQQDLASSSSSDGFQSRFSKIQGGTDESLQGRYNEVSDMLGTVGREWGVMEYLVGAGHGATFQPVLSFPERNVNDGRVHNIHIGPALMFYRYGIMGVVGWLWWLMALLAGIGRLLSPNCRETDRTMILAAGFVFLDSLMRNPFIDPVSGFGVAGIFHVMLGTNRGAAVDAQEADEAAVPVLTAAEVGALQPAPALAQEAAFGSMASGFTFVEDDDD